MSEHIHKSHNVSKLMYHFVFPTKYRRVVVSEEMDEEIKETCEEISKRYDPQTSHLNKCLCTLKIQ